MRKGLCRSGTALFALSLDVGDDRPIDERPEETQTVFEYSATASPDVCDYQYLNTFIDISSQPAAPLRIVLDRKGRCDEKTFAKILDAGIKK